MTRIYHEKIIVDGKSVGFTGVTWACIWDGENRYIGLSECGRNDQFSRKRGREIAVGRAKTAEARPSQVKTQRLVFIVSADGAPNYEPTPWQPKAPKFFQRFLDAVPDHLWKPMAASEQQASA